MIDNLPDLPDGRKAALKELLSSQSNQAVEAGEVGGDGEGTTTQLPAEVKEAIEWTRSQRELEAQRESNARLEVVLNLWRQQDTEQSVKFNDRQRLMYVQAAAGAGGFQTLEELSDAARKMALDDRDEQLGSVVTRPSGGIPRSVPAGGVPRPTPEIPKTMADARKLIEADIAAGRFPDLLPGG
jgi:hypothetical protein